MKRVLIFSLAYFPKHVGGAEVAIKEKTDRITDVEFHMVTLRYDSTLPAVEKVGNILVHRIGFTRPNATMSDLKKFPLHYNKYWFQFAAAFKALRLHRQYHYDATWAMMAHSCGVPAAIFKLFHPRVPFILELQEGDPIDYIERLMRPLWFFFSRAFTSADTICAISNFLGRWAQSRGFRGRLLIIPNAVDIAHFSQNYPPTEIEAIQKQFNKKEGDIFLITTSRLVHKNAVDDVIRALPLLPERVHFIILGIGPDEVKLKKLADDLLVAERVQFVGQVQHADLPKYLHASDIFIRPSRSEGMGNSFVEAFAAGVPVIATAVGGIPDFLFDPVANPDKPSTGIFCEVNSPVSIAAAVQKYLDNPVLTQKIIENAHILATEKYDWDIIAVQMKKEVFDTLTH